ncbi:MAG TPA: hypothetical protein VFU52_01020 [Gaiellaceae bacterium]|nr:hypothetical protein [Gaiellaceae bacterium]
MNSLHLGVGRSRLAVAAVVIGLAFAVSATALAANGYKVWGTAWHRPPAGSLFTVLSHGTAPKKALLRVYLDRQACSWSWATEAKRFTSYRAGQSTFKGTGHAFITLWVNGRFSKAFTARAGTTAQPEYACSYLTTPNSQGLYRITSARRSNAYFVTG